MTAYPRPGRVICRMVPEWMGESGTLVRNEVLRDVRRVLGAGAAEACRPTIEGAPLESLVAARRRIPFIESPAELFASDWRFGVEPLSLPEILHHAFGNPASPLGWGILMEARHRKLGVRHRPLLLSAVPWLALLAEPDRWLDALITHGWLACRCTGETRAVQLCGQVRLGMLQTTVLGPCGRRGNRGGGYPIG